MFRYALDSAKAAIKTTTAAANSIHQFIYGAIDGQLSTYEESFFRCANELRIKNNGKLPLGSVVLHEFMEKYIKRASRPTTDMSKQETAEQCKLELINRGDEAIPFAMEHIRALKELDENGYFAALLNVFFYLFPQHDPRDIEVLKNKEGKRKVLSPAKFQLNKWYKSFTDETTFPPSVAGYQLEQVAETMPAQYVNQFADCLLRLLPPLEHDLASDLDYALVLGSRFVALGITYHKINTRDSDLRKKIEARIKAEGLAMSASLNASIVGAALALRSITSINKNMSTALMSYVSLNIHLILTLSEKRSDPASNKANQERSSFLRKVFQALLAYESSFEPAQKQTIMFQLMQPKYYDTFRYEINMLRNWMSQDQLNQFRKEMLPKKETDDETWYVCRPWLEDETFLETRGPVYPYRGEQPYHDKRLMNLLVPFDKNPGILTCKVSFATRLNALMRDIAGDESIEKVDGKFIPHTVVTALQTVIPALCKQLHDLNAETFANEYRTPEAVKNLYEKYMQLMDAIPLLSSSQAFTNEQRTLFAAQILESQDYLESDLQHRPACAALSIGTDFLADASLKAKCENGLIIGLHPNYRGEYEADIIKAFKIYANAIPFKELPSLMLAIGSSNPSNIALLALVQVNKVYEKRLPSTLLRARANNAESLAENRRPFHPGV